MKKILFAVLLLLQSVWLLAQSFSDKAVYRISPAPAGQDVLWTITPGVAREYALRFRYKNTTAAAIAGRLQVADSKGTLVVDRDITFPPTPNKFKTIATTTATQINAGHYKVTVKGAAGVVFDYLEVQ